MATTVSAVCGGRWCVKRRGLRGQGRPSLAAKRTGARPQQQQQPLRLAPKSLFVCRAEDGEREGQPSSAQPPSTSTSSPQEEVPLWVRREQARELSDKDQEGKLPFGVYLLASSIIAIAAIASIFEYTYQNAIFSVIPPTSFLYKPILGIFVFTGLPLSMYLFYKAIQAANELSESMDQIDDMK
mmetsp:Transcript_8435/g.20911  ORF Transcript_8435/g.20911 Transcript_8435/m.20911 type:complete len:184 (-) Transcript_8435:1055-1606(-)